MRKWHAFYVCFHQASADVKNLEDQLLKLCNELKQAQIKLDEAENMKRNLQDRSETPVNNNLYTVIFLLKQIRYFLNNKNTLIFMFIIIMFYVYICIFLNIKLEI